MYDLINAWPVVATSGAIVFSAGVIVGKLRNGKYVHKEVCAEHIRSENKQWEIIEKWMEKIEKKIDQLS